MKTLFRKLIFAGRFRKAVRTADKWHHITHRKYLVVVVNGKLEVISKQELKNFIHIGVFRKGTTIQDIEQRALYITH